MEKKLHAIGKAIQSFSENDEGVQVVEYALVIAMVSIVLALALGNSGLGTAFASLVTRITNCFAPGATTC